MVVIASDHRLLKVSWRGEPWWTARCRPFGQEDTGRCDEQVGIGLLKAVDSVCFDMFWPLGVTFPGWNLPVNALLVSKRWSNFQQVPWSSFFLHNHNESHRITMNHSRFLEDLLLVLEDGKIGSMGSYEELQRSSATLKASLWSLWRSGRGPWKVRKTRDPQNCWIWVINIIYWLVLNDSDWCWMILNDVEWYSMISRVKSCLMWEVVCLFRSWSSAFKALKRSFSKSLKLIWTNIFTCKVVCF